MDDRGRRLMTMLDTSGMIVMNGLLIASELDDRLGWDSLPPTARSALCKQSGGEYTLRRWSAGRRRSDGCAESDSRDSQGLACRSVLDYIAVTHQEELPEKAECNLWRKKQTAT